MCRHCRQRSPYDIGSRPGASNAGAAGCLWTAFAISAATVCVWDCPCAASFWFGALILLKASWTPDWCALLKGPPHVTRANAGVAPRANRQWSAKGRLAPGYALGRPPISRRRLEWGSRFVGRTRRPDRRGQPWGNCTGGAGVQPLRRCSAVTKVRMPPRTYQSAWIRANRGRMASTMSSRMALVTFS